MPFFSAHDVLSSATIPKLFIHASTLHLGFRISTFYFINGEIAAPKNRMKWANVLNLVDLVKAIGLLYFSMNR